MATGAKRTFPQVFSQERTLLRTEEELYVGNQRAGGIIPAFNNIYDVTIDFASTSQGSGLFAHILEHTLFETDQPPGVYLSLFCSEALLPGSQIQTAKVDGLRQGLSQSYALYRRFPDINLTWYSQRDYFTNDVFNAWMEYISPTHNGENVNDFERNIRSYASSRKLRYPDSYKCNMEITSFNRNLQKSFITYYIRKAFPVNIIAAPLAYGKAELIKTTVSFNYEDYYVQRQAENKGTPATMTGGPSNQPEPGAGRQETRRIPTPVQDGQEAARTESTRTGYKDPYRPKSGRYPIPKK